MDPFSITAGVAGLLSLSLQTHQILAEHVRSIKDAPKEAEALAVKLTALISVLEQLERFLEKHAASGNFKESCIIYGTTKRCTESLEYLHLTLTEFVSKTSSDSKTWRRFMKWPMTKGKHQQIITVLEGYLAIFVRSASIDGLALASKTLEELRAHGSALSDDIYKLFKSVLDLATRLDHCQFELSLIKESLLDAKRLELLTWMSSSVDPSHNYNRAIKNRRIGTGEWLLTTEAFTQWTNDPGFLWLHGIPGSGKTVLCSTIIEAIKSLSESFPDRRLAYFYFDFQELEKQEVEPFVRSLLRQLLANERRFPEHIVTMYKNFRDKGQSPSLKELRTALDLILKNSSINTYIVVDALDEFPRWTTRARREEMLTIITELALERMPTVHLLATSRAEPDIREALDRTTRRVVCLDGSVMNDDIAHYVQSRLMDPTDRLNALPEALKFEIVDTVQRGAHGMFRWAVCQLDLLRQCRKAKDIRETLKDLPTTLDGTYERMLANINPKDHPEALAILYWLTSARAPLKLREIAEAATIQPLDQPFDPEARLLQPSEALHICGGLVECSGHKSEGTKIVRFAHYSVQEFLVSGRASHFAISINASHNHISGSCLRYLQHLKGVQNPKSKEYPLLPYAARSWFEHLKAAEEVHPLVMSLVHSLFNDEFALHSMKWLYYYEPCTDFSKSEWIAQHSPPSSVDYGDYYVPAGYPTYLPGALYYAVHHGLHDVAAQLLQQGTSVNDLHAIDLGIIRRAPRTALHLAVSKGGFSFADLLVAAGADPNICSLPSEVVSCHPLGVAVGIGHVALIRLLLDHGANPEVWTKSSPSLIYTIRHGRIDITSLLLAAGSDVNVREPTAIDDDTTPLLAACLASRADIVELLLQYGAELDMPNTPYRALQMASWKGDLKTLQMLLQAGVHPDEVGDARDRGTPLSEATKRRDVRMISLLLQHGASINKAPHSGQLSPLGIAAAHDDSTVAELLIRAGADVNIQPYRELPTPLCFAAWHGNTNTVRVLLDAGADINAYSDCSLPSTCTRTKSFALLAAADGGSIEVLRLLLASGARVEPPTLQHDHAMTAAAVRGRDDMVQLLIKSGVAMNPPGCLQRTAREKHWVTVRILIETGADVHAHASQQPRLPSLIYAAASAGELDMVKFFLDLGLDADCRWKGRTPLRIALGKGHSNIARLLRHHTTRYTKSLDAYSDIMKRVKKRGRPGQTTIERAEEVCDQGQ